MVDSKTHAQTRRRGRQTEAARNDWAVLHAAREVIATVGADAPVSAIADRAGVGIGSLYRRYPTKDALLQRLCVLAMEQSADAAEAALTVADPWDGLAGYVRACVGLRTGALAPLAGTIPVTGEMVARARQGTRLVETLVTRARAAEALREDVEPLDIALLIEQFSRRPPGLPPDEEVNARERLLTIALDGLRARDRGPLPGRPPSAENYIARWTG